MRPKFTQFSGLLSSHSRRARNLALNRLFPKNIAQIFKKKVVLFFSWVRLAVICNKCTADYARFLFQNETGIDARVWRAQSAIIGIYNIFILNFSGARVRARRARKFVQLSCHLISLTILNGN